MKCRPKFRESLTVRQFDLDIWLNKAHPYWMVNTVIIDGESLGITGILKVPVIKTKEGNKAVQHGDYIVGLDNYEVLSPEVFRIKYEIIVGD